jgi:hypothetical protein
LQHSVHAEIILLSAQLNDLFHDIVVRDVILPTVEPATVYQVKAVVELVPVCLIQQVKVLSDSLCFKDSLRDRLLCLFIITSARFLLPVTFEILVFLVLGLPLDRHFFADLFEVVSLVGCKLELLAWRLESTE